MSGEPEKPARQGRYPVGSNHHNSKLSESDVENILSAVTGPSPWLTVSEAARHWGISRAAIYKILAGSTWRHVPRAEAG